MRNAKTDFGDMILNSQSASGREQSAKELSFVSPKSRCTKTSHFGDTKLNSFANGPVQVSGVGIKYYVPEMPEMRSRTLVRVSTLAVVVLLCLSAILLGQTTSELIRKALETYQRGDLATAIVTLRQAAKADPTDPYTKLYLGLFLYEEDTKSLEAQQLLESVADRFADNPEVQVKLMDSYLAHGQKAKGLAQLRRLEPAASANEQLAFQLAYLLIRYGLTDAAREHTERIAARIAPEGGQPSATPDRRLGEVRFLQGLVAAAQDRKANALASLQAADKQDFPPRDSYQMLILADALYQLQETRLASQAYQEYLKHHTEDVDARFRLGLTYYASGALDAAQAAFEQVRGANPQYPEVNYQLAEILFSKNNLDEAEQTLRAEMERDPGCGPCMAKLARIQHQRGETELAEKSLEAAREIAPDWAETHLVAGLLANRKGNYEEAIRELEIVAGKLPGFATAHLQLSIAYSRAGRAEKAKEHRDIYNRLIQEQKDAVSAAVKDERKPRP